MLANKTDAAFLHVATGTARGAAARRGSRSLRKAVWRFSSAALSCPCEVCNIEVRPFLTPPYLPS